jgi:hypothetical protein
MSAARGRDWGSCDEPPAIFYYHPKALCEGLELKGEKLWEGGVLIFSALHDFIIDHWLGSIILAPGLGPQAFRSQYAELTRLRH